MRARLFLSCVSVVVLSGCAGHKAARMTPPTGSTAAPAVVVDSVREALLNDYMRVSFLTPGTPVTTIARPGALRGFVTATVLYSPPLTVTAYPTYSGLVNDDSKVLVAMRCKPADATAVDATLATWPNVFAAVVKDVPVDPGECDAVPSDPGKQVACYAKRFGDPADTSVPAALARTFEYAGTIYDGKHTAWAQWLQSSYGIYAAFAGTGYSVKDSYFIDKQPMTSQQILVKSVSSEYLLKNVTLEEAGCRCISVPKYDGRASARLDPEFVWEQGGDGSCKSVDRLR
jgi:hypothetical protein